ncbi:MAG: hypothetical protein SFU86_08060 [Pirellulaceae bacterium]|nr:hypothetical protein [Pirellulaceae bacterium]
MRRARWVRSGLLVSLGLVAGLAIGGALAAGLYFGNRSSAATAALDEVKLRASATHGAESFAIATGAIDEEVEGLFMLDYLTGDLQVFAINPRTGALGGWFKTNVTAALPPEKGKKPSFLLVTGQVDWSSAQIAGNTRPATVLCWVADENTGNFAAFSFPWTRAVAAAGVTQAQQMFMVYKGKGRTLEIRE